MKRFLRIYFWQLLSLISGFATMFVVTPFLSSNQSLFGIYSLVVSLNLFLAYSDFGFLSAGVKFASEEVIRRNVDAEQKILGFLFFIMSIVFALCLTIVVYFYSDPTIVLRGINNDDEVRVAKDLFLIFILSAPVTLCHRILQLIFNIRLEDYKYQRVFATFNLLKIVIAVLLFSHYEYPIVAYYASFHILNFMALAVGIYLTRANYAYDYKKFLKNIRFNKEIFSKTRSLAVGSLVVTVSWIIYYELDSFVIGKFIGIHEVALFSVCLSLMTFSRSLFGIIYNPFSVKFNYYLGEGRVDEFKVAFRKIIILGFPISVFSTFIFVLTMGELITLWVGQEYLDSRVIAVLMYSSYFFSFLSYPAGIAMIAKQKLNSMYLVSFILPIIYWTGILGTYNYLGLVSFGLFKFIAFFLSALVYYFFSWKEMGLNFKKLFIDNIFAIMLVFIFIYLVCSFVTPYFPTGKNSFYLFIYLLFIGSVFLFSCLIFFFFSKDFKVLIANIYKELVKARITF